VARLDDRLDAFESFECAARERCANSGGILNLGRDVFLARKIDCRATQWQQRKQRAEMRVTWIMEAESTALACHIGLSAVSAKRIYATD
jgi:hypothetical protein